MESRSDIGSILALVPVILRSSALFWPPSTVAALKAITLGPDSSRIDSGELLFDAILDLRHSLGLSSHSLASNAAAGYALFFDDLMSRMDSRMWFGEVIPELARLVLRLPSLLEAHYQHADETFGKGNAGLRILDRQDAGIVFLSQELIAALLACALFCLFPTNDRGGKHLPTNINFDYLFAALQPTIKPSQEQKIKCLVHYFERVCLCMPTGFVSFERKVLPLESNRDCLSYPKPVFWRRSNVPLCSFKVFSSGLIEDQQHDAVEVDFANEYLGGGALHRGCVQEEIRFMINPELIIGMLFLPSMEQNEAIEIIGVERFSSYIGYGSSFRFVGDYLDTKPFDFMGRRKTRIVAIDALFCPRMRQYSVECLVRETNKAFCGFLDQSNCHYYQKLFQELALCDDHLHQKRNEAHSETPNTPSAFNCTNLQSESPNSCASSGNGSSLDLLENANYKNYQMTGVATGNWGCGAFGGDPELKSIIQWLAASQALRPFIHYYTFGEAALGRLEQVTQWIQLHAWTVGDLWSMLVEYSSQRLHRKTDAGFLNWLLPMLDEAVEYGQFIS